ncbi:multidrug and toxin extrusion protein 1 isoform X2 [Centropristis striata]|uniref:multidrug and toxin extrusion protein 1 isoform X2 n=1 Tax=Centropristis striata TaxID=184440 RepID=UPI0027E1AC53|nr:multidrug and toxin extrusion protein 1 isoform X2 [Centropristis striata]
MEKLGSPEPAHPLPGAWPVAGVSAAKTARAEEDKVPVSDKLFRCACVRRWLPLAYREELYQVLLLTGPLLLSRILNFLMPFVTTIFCGHIGNAELAGYALASAIINLSTTATGYGLSMACDTLISQTFGSKNMKRVGVILQRGLLILLMSCLPCWGLLINSYQLLLVMHQQEEVARIAQLYVMAFLPAVPAQFLHQLQVAYLQNQRIILPQMYTAAAANIVNLGANYVLIFSLELGVVGSAIANSLSQIVICLLLFGYIRWKKLHQQTWGGWSTDCLQDWGSYMKLAIPSLFMICFEWYTWRVGSCCAACVGGNRIHNIHVPSRYPCSCLCACWECSGGRGNFQGHIHLQSGPGSVRNSRSDPGYRHRWLNIVAIVSENLTVYIFLQFFDSLLCVCSGILIGAGMQKIAALSNLVAYYCVALPVGIALTFFAKLRIMGLWLGLLMCVFLEVCFFLFLIYRLNWKKVTQKAQQRAGNRVVMIPKRPASTVLTEAMVPGISDRPTAQLDAEEASKADGYTPVNTQDQELKAVHEAEASNTNTGGAEGDAEQNKKTSKTKTQAPLPLTQLILRRGMTFLVLALALAIGVAFHLAFPMPDPSTLSRANFTLNWANDSTPTPLAPLDLTPKL